MLTLNENRDVGEKVRETSSASHRPALCGLILRSVGNGLSDDPDQYSSQIRFGHFLEYAHVTCCEN